MPTAQSTRRTAHSAEGAHRVLGDDPEAARIPGAADAEDEHVAELKTKVAALVSSRFGGDYKKAFEHYDAEKTGGVDADALVQLLRDAGIGSGFTRGIWARKIIAKMDGNHDGRIEWGEFQSGIH